MNAWRWISLAMFAVLLVGWTITYVRSRDRLGRPWNVLGALLIVSLLQSLAGFFPDTAVGWALMVLSLVAAIYCGVLVVREARATWREQMERVKHL